MVTKRFPIQLLFRIKHWLGQYVITMDIMRVGFPSLVQAYSRYTAIKLLLFLPLPLAIKQGGYTRVGYRTDVNIAFPISFSHVLGIAGLAVVNDQNSNGRGLEHIKEFSGSSFTYYSGYDITNKWLTWLAVGI